MFIEFLKIQQSVQTECTQVLENCFIALATGCKRSLSTASISLSNLTPLQKNSDCERNTFRTELNSSHFLKINLQMLFLEFSPKTFQRQRS